MHTIALSNREPWLLTCATPLDHLSARSIVNLYAQRMRMRIEQQFRIIVPAELSVPEWISFCRAQPKLPKFFFPNHAT